MSRFKVVYNKKKENEAIIEKKEVRLNYYLQRMDGIIDTMPIIKQLTHWQNYRIKKRILEEDLTSYIKRTIVS